MLHIESAVKVVCGVHHLLKSVLAARMVLLAGGPILDHPLIRSWLRILLLCKFLGKPVALYGCGLGPIQSKIHRVAAQLLVDLADYVFLRDQLSVKWARLIGAQTKASLSADASLALDSDPKLSGLRSSHRAKNGIRVGFCLRDLPSRIRGEDSFRLLSNAIELLVRELDARVTLIPYQTHPFEDDRRVIQRVASLVTDQRAVDPILSELELNEVFDITNEQDLIITMRLHGALFASMLRIPTIGICLPQTSKLRAYLSNIGLGDYVVSLDDLTPERLLVMVDRAFRNYDALRESLHRIVPKLSQLALEMTRRIQVDLA